MPSRPDAAIVLQWIAHHFPDQALKFARAHITRATVGEPDALDTVSTILLGASNHAEDHDALLGYAARYVAAGHHGPHGSIVGHLTTISPTDIAELTSRLGHQTTRHLDPTSTGSSNN